MGLRTCQGQAVLLRQHRTAGINPAARGTVCHARANRSPLAFPRLPKAEASWGFFAMSGESGDGRIEILVLQGFEAPLEVTDKGQ